MSGMELVPHVPRTGDLLKLLLKAPGVQQLLGTWLSAPSTTRGRKHLRRPPSY